MKTQHIVIYCEPFDLYHSLKISLFSGYYSADHRDFFDLRKMQKKEQKRRQNKYLRMAAFGLAIVSASATAVNGRTKLGHGAAQKSTSMDMLK